MLKRFPVCLQSRNAFSKSQLLDKSLFTLSLKKYINICALRLPCPQTYLFTYLPAYLRGLFKT